MASRSLAGVLIIGIMLWITCVKYMDSKKKGNTEKQDVDNEEKRIQQEFSLKIKGKDRFED